VATPSERLIRRILLSRGYVPRRVSTSTGLVHALEGPGRGALPPIVAVHGFGASGVQLAPLLRFLRPAAQRVTIVDLPAHGFSDIPPGAFDTDVMLGGILEALDQLVTEPVILLGNSLRFALRAPAKVAKLVLVSPGGAKMDQATLDGMRSLFHVRSHRDALGFVDRLVGKRTAARHLMALSVRRRLGRRELITALDAIRPDQLLHEDEVSALSMPTLCVWGRGDGILPRENLEFFRAHLPPQARVVEPDGMGHSPYLEAPRALADLVLDFARAG
jgi:pimeloyl-ACP methyl ester carboxylesterase